jgi:hypothetical protein
VGAHVGKNFRNGLLKKGEFPDGPAQMQGFMMNLRKPMFRTCACGMRSRWHSTSTG